MQTLAMLGETEAALQEIRGYGSATNENANESQRDDSQETRRSPQI
jgi:hypothetical protein